MLALICVAIPHAADHTHVDPDVSTCDSDSEAEHNEEDHSSHSHSSELAHVGCCTFHTVSLAPGVDRPVTGLVGSCDLVSTTSHSPLLAQSIDHPPQLG